MIQVLAALTPYSVTGGVKNAQSLREFVLLLRCSGLRIGDAAQLTVDRLQGNKLLLHTEKTGVQVYFVLTDVVIEAINRAPRSSERHFFWIGTCAVHSSKGKWQRS
jgi:hypothetical protein